MRIIVLILFIFIELPASASIESRPARNDNTYNTSSHVDRLNTFIFEQWSAGNFADSIIYEARQVLEIAQDIDYKKGEADAFTNLVRLHLKQYESSISLEYALSAIKLYEELGDKENAGYNLMQIGVIYYTSQNLEKSQEYYDRAIIAFTELDNKEKLATLYYLSGLNNTALENYDIALEQLRNAYRYKESLDNTQGMAECLSGIAQLYLNRNEADSALNFLQKAEELVWDTGNEYGKAKIRIMGSEAYRLKGDIQTSTGYAKEALLFADMSDARELRLESYQALSRSMELFGEFESAYRWHIRFMALRDSIFNEKNSMRISQLESAYRIEKSENRVEILEREKRTSDIILKGTIAIVVLVLVILFVVYRQYKLNKRSNNELTQAYQKLKDTQEQLVQHKKLASLGSLASGIAHEIQNPLNFVNNFSDLSIETLSDLEETDLDEEQKLLVKDLIEGNRKIHSHGRRAQAIVRSMQDHSNMNSGVKQATNINNLLNSCVSAIQNEFENDHPGFHTMVMRELDPSIPAVETEQSQVARVFTNVINNAFHALHKKFTAVSSGFRPEVLLETKLINNRILVCIKDNGIGMNSSSKERAFEPFYTTKPEGTGLGLSLSYDIIAAHGGDIEIHSGEGEFTEVIIQIPVTS
jgi:signal transduction histidine kinase